MQSRTDLVQMDSPLATQIQSRHARPCFPKPVLSGESVSRHVTPPKPRPPGYFLMLALHRAKQRQLKGRLFFA